MSVHHLQERSAALVCAAAIACAAGLAGCGGGSDDGPPGGSTVSGDVASFAGGSVHYLPHAPQGLLARARNLLLPDAWAAVAGVTITVQGTDLEATTADDGSFIISGVPGGVQTLLFTYNGITKSLDVTVPENGTIRLNDVDVGDDGVDVGSVEVEVNPDDDNGNGNDNGDDDNGNDNDDNGNDNDDDNGNDNDDDNGNDNGDDNGNDNDDNDND